MLDIEQMIAKMKPHTRFPSIGDDQDKTRPSQGTADATTVRLIALLRRDA
jgi:hypothetical protein